MQRSLVVYVILWLTMTCLAECLKCWKCVAHDCETNPETNYKASKTSCDDGQQCMKVRYRMFDNVTHYDSVIRTCSAGACSPTAKEQFQKCIRTPKNYLVEGCILRSCCSDKDLCNSSEIQFLISFPLLIFTVTFSRFISCEIT